MKPGKHQRSKQRCQDLRSAHTRGLVRATSPVKCSHVGTDHMDLSHEKLTGSFMRN